MNFENKITKVEKDSIAQELEIDVGDILIAINGEHIEDIIEYQYLEAEEYLELEIEKQNGEHIIYEIDKDIDEQIGLEFENPIIDSVKSCRNKCIFCFVDQLPSGMRDTLYFKDDDSRLSFLQGNFITMTNMGDKEIDKMIKYRISPVNVSVHTTNPKLRASMLGNRFAGDILEKMNKLKLADISMNAQIVLVPNVNDKKELEKTIIDLGELYPQLNSIAVVPIGITKHRENLCKLDIFDKKSASLVIDQIEKMQLKLLNSIGTRFVFLSDEFYVMANREMPVVEAYEGYIQLENGVGLISKFENEIISALDIMEHKYVNRHVSLATGKSAFNFISDMAKRVMQQFEGLRIDVHLIKNIFFGETITVSGLITAGDIRSQLNGLDLGEALIIPRSMMKSDEDVFLDNITVKELQDSLNIPILISEVEGQDFIDKILARV